MRHSHSSLEQFKTCPYQYYRERVTNDVEQALHRAAEVGKHVHEVLERSIHKPTPPKGYEPVIKSIQNLQERMNGANIQCERVLKLNDELEPVADDDPTHFIGVIDVLIVNSPYAFVVDYKTGKRKDSFTQLERYAFATFQYYPDVSDIMTGYYWLKHGKIDWYRFTRANAYDRIRFELEMAIGAVENAKVNDNWPKKTSGLCNGWCSVDDCIHWRPRRKKI